MKAVVGLVVLALASLAAGEQAVVDTGSLLVAPGAEQLQVQPAKDGVAAVEFDVREPYPALKTIGFLVDALAKQGWQVAMPGAYRPPRPPVKQRPVAQSHRGFHEWEGRWRNAAGQEITYKLVYDCPLEQYGMHSVILHASGYWYDKANADRREAERKRETAEFCADLRKRIGAVRIQGCEE